MSFFFGPKRNTVSEDEKLRLTNLHVEQQREENHNLRRNLDEISIAANRSKILLQEMIARLASYESNEREMVANIQELKRRTSQQTETISQIRDEISKSSSNPDSMIFTDFQMVSNSGTTTIQDVLDASERHNEQIFFKDTHGAIWQIVKRPGVSLS